LSDVVMVLYKSQSDHRHSKRNLITKHSSSESTACPI